jgi:hypothetical protein
MTIRANKPGEAARAVKKPGKTLWLGRLDHAMNRLCDLVLQDSDKMDGSLAMLRAQVRRVYADIVVPWGKAEDAEVRDHA